MLYLTCPTCGYFLGNKTLEFEKKKEEICKNPKLKKAERDEKIHKLILSLNLRRYCCRMRIMSYKDLVQDIIPID